MKPLNVLFITFDQWRADCLGAHGHPSLKTPHIDGLVADAVDFRCHYTALTPCGPSRASIHTGLYGFNHRSITNGTPLDARHKSWAEILRREGYDPVLFGYTDTSVDPRGLSPDNPRLFSYEGLLPGLRPELFLVEELMPWLDDLKAKGYGRHDIHSVYATKLGEPALFARDDSETAFLTDRFLDWHRSQKDEAWCAHLSYIKPHPPFVAAAPFNDLVDQSLIPKPLPKAHPGLHPFVDAYFKRPLSAIDREMIAPTLEVLDEARIMKIRQVYLGLVAELDHHVGRIVARLSAAGELEKTLVILTSDHGELLGDYGLLGKGGFYDEAFHVPLIIRHPSLRGARGRALDAMTSHVDLMPTLLEAVGIDIPLQVDGHSLMQFLRDGREPEGWRDGVMIEHDFRELAKRFMPERIAAGPGAASYALWLDRTHATVHFGTGEGLMFDRVADPAWQHDIFKKSPDVALEKLQAMFAHRMRHAERRLTECQITSEGLKGRFDDLDGRMRSGLTG